MNNITKRVIAGALVLATMVPICNPSFIKVDSAIAASSIDEIQEVYVNIKYLASTELDSNLGDFVDPSTIKSASEITYIDYSNTAKTLNPLYFFDTTDTNLKKSKMTAYNPEYELIFSGMIRVVNYNDTGFDLYYKYDPETKLFYQTLNTNYLENNTVIPTDTSILVDDIGEKEISIGKNNMKLYSSAEWILKKPTISISKQDFIDTVYDNNKSSIMSIITDSDGTNTMVAAREYKLFGSTWVRCNSYYNNEWQSKYPDLDARNMDLYNDLNNNGYIISNGSAGDVIQITSLYSMVNDTHIVYDNSNTNDLLTQVTFEYKLKEDKESLPVGYGIYTIYNKSTGIYETVSSYGDVFDPRFSEIKEKLDEESKDVVYTTMYSLGLDLKSHKYNYDVPERLNISNKEYLTVAGITLDEDTDSRYKAGYFYINDKKNLTTEQKIRTAISEIPEEDRSLDYVNVASFELPSNTSELFAYYTSSSLSQYGSTPLTLSKKLDYSDYGNLRTKYSITYDYLCNIDEYTIPSKYTVFTNVYNQYESTAVKGDANQDGQFNVADIVSLQKWLLADPNADVDAPGYVCANFCVDNKLDVFDLCLAKRFLIDRRV